MSVHILIAEDENHTRLGLSLILRKAGYRVSLAEDGLAALALLRKAKTEGPAIDLFLTDIQMPGLTGLELLDAMAREGISLPTAAITGYGDKDMVVSLMRRGCMDYLDKPFTPDEVQRCIENLYKQQQSALENEDSGQNRDVERLRLDLASRQKEIQEARKAHAALTRVPKAQGRIRLSYISHAYGEMGGDFLDFREHEKGCDLLLADVAGHDMASSYHTVMLKAFFEDRPEREGACLFRALNTQLLASANERMISALFLRTDLPNSLLQITTAAHPAPLVMERQGKLYFPEAAGDGIGLWPDATFATHTHRLNPGDRILLFTDGISQARRIHGPTGKREILGERGLMTLARQHQEKDLETFLACLWEDVMAFCRRKPADDMLMAAMEIPETLLK
ncbi:PP2C family protein-serine/threonine phosphatase [Desulfobotulus sp.]|jgi:DNA-binding response OmpR family regulator|uniref:PP2C family protein-serine/threonine phosphatase n=1 Tax=Desulfobotulus sp. TaxID=1940337 RepID=UPI002A367E01|nr:SpoIIE family protein phosphatase [Desulfobotulus sp.]MDY0161668.1 SpoIIE family protein phosphatase [Desulfobotulus sp.]